MNENDMREEEQVEFSQEPGDASAEQSAADEIEIVDVQLGSGVESPEASAANDDEVEAPATDSAGDFLETASPEPEAAEVQIPTQPILDQNGNMPRTIEALMIALAQWQEAAAVPSPMIPASFFIRRANCARNLLETGGAPWQPSMWVDRETMTPVKYQESQFGPPPAAEEWPQRPKVTPGACRRRRATAARRPAHPVDPHAGPAPIGISSTPWTPGRLTSRREWRELIKQEIEREQWRQYCLDLAILGGR